MKKDNLITMKQFMDDSEYAEKAVFDLVRTPLESYFKGYEKQFIRLLELANIKNSFDLKGKYIYDIAFIFDRISEDDEYEALEIIFMPVVRSNYCHRYFTFSLKNYINVLTKYIYSGNIVDICDAVKDKWSSITDMTLNKVTKHYFTENRNSYKYSGLRTLTFLLFYGMSDLSCLAEPDNNYLHPTSA